MSYSPRYESVQQRSKQRDAARFESLATAIMPLVIIFSTLTCAFFYLSAKYATWEKDMHERLSASGLADGVYEPSPVAKPGLFITNYWTAVQVMFFIAVAIGAIMVAHKIAKWLK